MEGKLNENEDKRLFGTVIKYGQIVQILHQTSNKFVCAERRVSNNIEKNAMRVTLDEIGNDGAWFKIMPSFKHKSANEEVMVGDQVELISDIVHLPLNASMIMLDDDNARRHSDNLRMFEVRAHFVYAC